MKISTSEAMAKNTITKLLPENLATVRKLMEMNEQDFEKLLKPKMSDSAKKAIVRVMNQRRRKMAKLLEELSLRTSRIIPLMRKLEAVNRKMNDLQNAEKYLLKAGEMERRDPVIQDHIGDLYSKTGNLEKAQEFYKRSLSNGGEPEDAQKVRMKLEKVQETLRRQKRSE